MTLIGVFLISSGLSLLSGLTETNKGTVIDTLQNKWKVSYHILVRSPDTELTDEANNLMEPNFPGGIGGSISIKQYETIRGISDIEVAAPLAVIGYTAFGVSLDNQPSPQEPGVYRTKFYQSSFNGVQNQLFDISEVYSTLGPWNRPDAYEKYGVLNQGDLSTTPYYEFQELVVGIDPVQEQKLVGLNQTLQSMQNQESRYFNPTDISKAEVNTLNIPRSSIERTIKSIEFPILVSKYAFPENMVYTMQTDLLDIPFDTAERADQTMEKVQAAGVGVYLDTIPVKSTQYKVTYTSNQLSEFFTANLINRGMQFVGYRDFLLPSPLSYKNVVSPYADLWPYSYQLQTFNPPVADGLDSYLQGGFPEYYRPLKKVSDSNNPDLPETFALQPHFIGVFDPSLLSIAKDTGQQFPMDTYMNPSATSVLDHLGHPVNPPATLTSIYNPLGFMMSPPTMITTLDAAQKIIGDKPISVIRIKVKGVEDISDTNRDKLEAVAAQIRAATGLKTDITFASSPQPVLVQVPPSGTQTKLGWIQQQWIKLGSTFTLVREVKLGFSGILFLIVLVAVLYAVTTSWLSFLVRRREFGVLLALGWRSSQLRRMLLVEAAGIGLFAALITCSIQSVLILGYGRSISLIQFMLMGIISFLIYLIGAVIPIVRVGRLSSLTELKTGEVSGIAKRLTPVSHIFQLALAHFGGKRKRYILSIISIVMPTVLVMFFAFVTYRLRGTFHTSWLGEYAAVEVGPMHYLAGLIGLLMAVLTVAEQMGQNVSERSEEIALLKAIGWKDGAVRRLILWEGVFIGMAAGILSLFCGITLISFMYGSLPAQSFGLLTAVASIPMVAGLVGSIPPAVTATRCGLAKAMKGRASYSRDTEKIWRAGLALLMVAMLSVSAFSLWRLAEPRQTEKSEVAAGITPAPSVRASPLAGMVFGADHLEGFTPEPVENGNQAVYDLNLRMSDQGIFSVTAKIRITNTSQDTWDRLVFYMIPNVFTQKGNNDIYRPDARFSIHDIEVNGKKASYSLGWDTLSIPMISGVVPTSQIEVTVQYSFTLPEQGIRFSRTGESFDLAQWYPMLATYNRGGWNKEPYVLPTESYHTDFSDFTLQYQLPPGYQLITSSDDDPSGMATTGQLVVNQVRELLVSITGDLLLLQRTDDGTEINIWGESEEQEQLQPYLDTAAQAIRFFNEHIGLYPHKQIDVILGDRSSMEYPGVVTVNAKGSESEVIHTIVHEIAHQWFYGEVSSDPYHDGWLDEGMTELATSLFLKDFAYSENLYKESQTFSNLPLFKYRPGEVSSSLYAQPVVKFRDLLAETGQDGLKFLRTYYLNYRHKQVDTAEFIRFTMAYFGMTDNSFFDSWIKGGRS